MMGHEGMMRHGMMGQGGMMGAFPMRIIFALMDSDGDGTTRWKSFRPLTNAFFEAMDTDKDGTLSLEELQGFIRGRVAPQQAPAASASATQAGRGSPAGLKPLNASGARWLDSSSRPRLSTPGALGSRPGR
jgi:EF hand